VSAYDGDAPAPGPLDVRPVARRGFVTGDFLEETDAARGELARWVGEGGHRLPDEYSNAPIGDSAG
jgi:hypothetical protein